MLHEPLFQFVTMILRTHHCKILTHLGHYPTTTRMRKLTTTIATLTVAAAWVFAPNAFACGGDKHEEDPDEPSVLCDGDKHDDEADEPSVLCDGDKHDDEEDEPSVLCGGDKHEEDPDEPS